MFVIKNLIYILVFSSILLGSGAYDNGTATGKGKFGLDLTYNPFNIFKFGQSYAVMSYGITNKFDIHGYISNHNGNYYTYYAGVFYQFYKSNNIDLATSIGFRKEVAKKKLTFFFRNFFILLK